MISFLASPKPFCDVTKEHQYAAIRSWKQSHPKAEVILYGQSCGIYEAGRQLRVKVVSDIPCSPLGVPYFDAITKHSAVEAIHDIQVYINCDIVIYGVCEAIKQVKIIEYLMIGQRINLSPGLLIDVTKTGWKHVLKELVENRRAALDKPTAADYFVFRRGLWKDIPPIVIGRAGYDNALIAYCLRRNVPIIDSTFSVLALHPFHDYKHVNGGNQAVWNNSDAKSNLRYAGGVHSRVMISDAKYQLIHSRMQLNPCRGDKIRRIELNLRFQKRLSIIGFIIRILWRVMSLMNITGIISPDTAEVIKEQFGENKNGLNNIRQL